MTVYAGQKLTVADLYSESTYTPVVTQSNTPTLTVNHASYTKIGTRVLGNVYLTITSAGTASNFILVTVPLPILSTNAIVPAWGFFQTSGGSNYPFVTFRNTSTTFGLMATKDGSYLGVGTAYSGALANGDKISFTFDYQTTS